MEHKERKYEQDFSEYFAGSMKNEADQENPHGKGSHHIKEKVKEILKLSGNDIGDEQRQAMEELCKDNNKSLNCKLCGKQFNNLGNYRRHVRQVHTDIKPYKCIKCDTFFGDAGNLKRHDRAKHLKIRTPCPECNQSCMDKSDLRRHIRIKHLKITLKCKHCGVDFTTTYGISQHINKKHTQIPAEYKCDVCGEGGFLSTQDRSKHKTTVHGADRIVKKREYECPACKERFPSRMTRGKHLMSTHGIEEPNFKCEDCGKNFQTSIRLTFHGQLCVKKKNWVEDDTVPKGWKCVVVNGANLSMKKRFLHHKGKLLCSERKLFST